MDIARKHLFPNSLKMSSNAVVLANLSKYLGNSVDAYGISSRSPAPARSADSCACRLSNFEFPILEGNSMFRRLAILLALVFLISISARAQDRIQLFGGYSFERYGATPKRHLSGWELSGYYKLAPWVGITADLDAHYGLPSSLDARTLHLMAGPQFTIPFPGRFSPFVHVLGGLGHVRAGEARTSVAGAIGGGVDLPLAPLISWRVIQADYLITRFFNGTQNNIRISSGLVVRF
jgi:hypothetical protein